MQTKLQTDKNKFIEIFNAINFEKVVDHPNILIAAHFWGEERYEAAKICYRFMRKIDDLIDDYKSVHIRIARSEQVKMETEVKHWIQTVLNVASDVPEIELLTTTFHKFRIPVWPLEDFARSMVYDIYHDGFSTLDAFLDYATGASVAPASIFVHLCGLTCVDGIYSEPAFDVKQVATPCAVFSYLVHIIRDFVKDHTHNLNYFPDDLMLKHGLDRSNLLEMANGTELTRGFRDMMRELYAVADNYRRETCEVMERIIPKLEPRSQLSLQIIFDLYLMVFERIDIDNGTFTTVELNPTPAEIKERVWKVINSEQ